MLKNGYALCIFLCQHLHLNTSHSKKRWSLKCKIILNVDSSPFFVGFTFSLLFGFNAFLFQNLEIFPLNVTASLLALGFGFKKCIIRNYNMNFYKYLMCAMELVEIHVYIMIRFMCMIIYYFLRLVQQIAEILVENLFNPNHSKTSSKTIQFEFYK